MDSWPNELHETENAFGSSSTRLRRGLLGALAGSLGLDTTAGGVHALEGLALLDGGELCCLVGAVDLGSGLKMG